jgi:hypothetical protein
MKIFIKISLFFFAIINANVSFAINYFPNQEDTTIIIPDGKWIKGERLQPYHQSLISYNIINGQEVKTGSVDDTYQFIKINKKKYGLRVAKIILPGREILDSGLADISTFKPIYHHSHQTTKTMLFQFEDARVYGIVKTAQQTDSVQMNFSHPLFDSYYETLIARNIELKDGFLFKYPDFIYEEGGLVWQSGKIEKTNSSPFGKDIWVITYVDSKSGRKTSYWIDNKRNLKQVQYQFGDRISIQKPG